MQEKSKEIKQQGLLAQLEDHKPVPDIDFNLADLEKVMEEYENQNAKFQKEKNRIQNENQKHLIKRSKELHKPIPDILLIRVALEYPLFVSHDFYQEYIEWFEEKNG